MKPAKISFKFFLLFAILFTSCSTDVKIGKGNFYGKRSKIISGDLGGLKYVMLVTHGKHKYPLSVSFGRDVNTFSATKTTWEGKKYVTWFAVTDTLNHSFQRFGTTLFGGSGLQNRTFTPISKEDEKVLYSFSELLFLKNYNRVISKDSVNRIIGWVRVN